MVEGDPYHEGKRTMILYFMGAKVIRILQVGKGNFKPPPQVESSVVRIEPKVPRPQISYDEWDGLLRIVFVRRNRTIQAGFNSTPVMNMIERNYRTWCAQNDIALEQEPSEDVGMEDVEEEIGEPEDELMDVDDDMPSFFGLGDKKEVKKKSKGKIGDLVRTKVKKVLDETELGQQRAGKCDEADFLKYAYVTPNDFIALANFPTRYRLLYAFNQEGIHFS